MDKLVNQKPLRATSGEVVYTLPSPEDMVARGRSIEILRCVISDIRDKVWKLRSELIKEGHFKDDGITRDCRDVDAFLTASISKLYEWTILYPKWAEHKREQLEHPEIYVIREGLQSRG